MEKNRTANGSHLIRTVGPRCCPVAVPSLAGISSLCVLCVSGVRFLLFSLRNLLSANGIFLLLAFNLRLCLFLHGLLVFGFWRLVAHEVNAKVSSNTDQLRDLG
jgi:hypothetical protein